MLCFRRTSCAFCSGIVLSAKGWFGARANVACAKPISLERTKYLTAVLDGRIFEGMRRLAILILYIVLTIACHLGPSSPPASVASGNDVASMKRMLDAGLDPNAHDSAGYTPLIRASRAG